MMLLGLNDVLFLLENEGLLEGIESVSHLILQLLSQMSQILLMSCLLSISCSLPIFQDFLIHSFELFLLLFEVLFELMRILLINSIDKGVYVSLKG